MSVLANTLTERITIQRRITTKNPSNGEDVVTWGGDFTIYANFRPLQGRELYSARQLHAEALGVFTIRYRSGIMPEQRVLWKGKAYDIHSVIDVDNLHRKIELHVNGGMTNG